MKRPRDAVSVAALTVANLVPLAGVLFLDWDAAVIILLYWTENLVVGSYNILKMLFVNVNQPIAHLGKLFTIPFFCIHFGGFCAVHGAFILAFLTQGRGMRDVLAGQTAPGPLIFLQLLISVITRLWQTHPAGMEWAVLCLALSHGVSFVQNYVLGKEYATATLKELMGQPYKRIVLLHVAIIAGGAPVMMLGSPMPLLFILIAFKIAMDLWLHAKSHAVTPSRGKDSQEPASA